MEAQQHADDQSHYEISLTASQAFLAFVLLLLSLASSFAFGLMIGRGQADDRLVVRREPAIVTEGSVVAGGKKADGRIVELGVENNDFARAADSNATTTGGDAPVLVEEGSASVETPAPSAMSAPVEASAVSAPSAAASEPAPAKQTPTAPKTEPAVAAKPQAPAGKSAVVYAQLLSTGDQKRAEALAAKLIDGGFGSAYVERGTTDKGTVYRVRVKFPGEAEARAAEPRLRTHSPDVWIDRNL